MNGAAHDPRLTLSLPDEIVRTAADRIADILLEELKSAEPPPASPWLDVKGTMSYLGFSRDKLYKLTAARAIPFHKKRGGRRLLFHREELDRWVEEHYPSTGCTV